MADSIRERIFQKVETVLKDIVGIGEVHRGRADALNIQRYPAAFITAGDDIPVEDIGDRITRDMQLFIFLWQNTELEPHKSIEAFIPSVHVAMTADHTLGGLTIDVNPGSISGPAPLVDTLPDVGALMEFNVKYRTKFDDPYTI